MSEPGPVTLAHRIRVDVHAAWLSARDRRAPWYARAFGLALAAYALSPIDLIPDFIPVLGLADELILLPLGLWLFTRMLPAGLFDEHRAAAAGAAERPGSRWGAVVVISLWLLFALCIAWLLGFDYA